MTSNGQTVKQAAASFLLAVREQVALEGSYVASRHLAVDCEGRKCQPCQPAAVRLSLHGAIGRVKGPGRYGLAEMGAIDALYGALRAFRPTELGLTYFAARADQRTAIALIDWAVAQLTGTELAAAA